MSQLPNIIRRNGATQRAKRHGGLKTRAVPTTSRSYAAHAFLRQTFYPLFGTELVSTSTIGLAEKCFFDSVAYLCTAYQMELPPSSNQPFPLNIAATFQLLKEIIEAEDKHTCVFISGSKEQPVLGIARTLSMHYDLYYIPLYPIAQILREPKTRALGNLILSACGRLYHYGVSLCDRSSFIFYEMEMIADNLRDNAGDGEQHECEEEIRTAEFIISSTHKLSQCMAQPKNSHALQRRLSRITPHNQWERDMVAVIERINTMRNKYPCSNFHQQIAIDWNHNRGDEAIYPDQYLTFFWGGSSRFDDNLYEWVDVYLQESSLTVQPTSFQIFDQEQKIVPNPFDFEIEMLELITQFNQLLYEYSPY